MAVLPADILSYENFVESPFIIVKIGNYTFGDCTKSGGKTVQVNFPNFMKSLQITKTNGTINVYKLTMEYGITQFDDPNLMEAVLSSVQDTREITLTYGDWNMPNYIYKEEKALITNVTTSVEFRSSKITYIIDCTSKSVSLSASCYNFPAVTNTKGSTVINNMLYNKSYGLTDVFTGMSLKSTVINNNLIATDDKPVNIPAKARTSVLDYISYVCNYMTSYDDNGGDLKSSLYTWCVYDDYNNDYGGPYFKLGKKTSNIDTTKSGATFEVDVGYPGPNFVTDFTIKNDSSWSILYKFSGDIKMPKYSYSISDDGKMTASYQPSIMTGRYGGVTEADRSWWTNVTKFPIQAELTIKGLLRPAMLMTYVKINAFFYGHKHIASGVYFITKQVDTLSAQGYSTKLSLTRMGADS